MTVFFAPAEAAMIPQVVPRKQLVAANGVFTLTLNAAFAVGFALLGPIVVTLLGAPALILVVGVVLPRRGAASAGRCRRPRRPARSRREPQHGAAERGRGGDGLDPRPAARGHRVHPREPARSAGRSLYLGIAASLVGVLGVLGPKFAKDSLGLESKDFVVVVLPLAFGIVMGILLLNNFGHLMPRRRIIEFGLIALGILVFLIVAAGPISRFLQRAEAADRPRDSLADVTSLLAIVVFIALLAGIAYAFVAIPAQTQLQEDIPEDVRGRVFGVLNMLVSMASFLPIIIVGPVADVVGTTDGPVSSSAIAITVVGRPVDRDRGDRSSPPRRRATATGPATPAGLDPVAVATAIRDGGRRTAPLAPRRGEAAARPGAPPRPPSAAGRGPDAAEPTSRRGRPTPARTRELAESADAGRGDPAEDE